MREQVLALAALGYGALHFAARLTRQSIPHHKSALPRRDTQRGPMSATTELALPETAPSARVAVSVRPEYFQPSDLRRFLAEEGYLL